METKRKEPAAWTATPKEAETAPFNPVEFVGDIKEEIGRITWTSQEELKVYTQIVVGATFFCGMGLFAMDLFIQSLLHGLNYFVHAITG